MAAANGVWPDRAAELAELEAARAARPGDYVGRGAFVLEPEPLALLAPGASMSTAGPTDEGDGPEPFFSWSPCGACGSRLGGDRYGCTVVQPDPAVVDGAQLEAGAL